MKKGKRETLTVMEAMDELSRFAELDETQTVSTLSSDKQDSLRQWTDPKEREINQEKVKETFRVLHSYLKQVYEKGEKEAEDGATGQSIQALMLMANEAAQKIDRCTALFKGLHGEGGIQELKEFQDLQEFYLHKIKKKFQASLAKEEAWEAEWGGEEVDLLDIQRRGLKDLETVKRDKDYELFFIRKEDGNPFFSRNLLRHIKLVGKFDETISEVAGENPFSRVLTIKDRAAYEAAREILIGIHPLFDPFVKEAMLTRESLLVGAAIKALMALMLAANPRNLLENSSSKSAIGYFHDFQFFIREAVHSDVYLRAIEKTADQLAPPTLRALQIIHQMAAWFFTRHAHAGEGSVFIQNLLRKACKKYLLPSESTNPLWIWNALVDEDEHLRQYLAQYPSGPLLKALDVMREEEHIGFDPLYQDNLPFTQFRASGGDIDFDVLRLPSPTSQTHIHEAEIAPEFLAFLRHLSNSSTKKKFLLIHLQDRTSWNEHARAVALEDLQKQIEFSDVLYVVNLPKQTEFYLQSGDYENLDGASDFKNQLLQQVASGPACGFFFPVSLKIADIQAFTKKAVEMIHATIFGGKDLLTRKNRLDFIELYYYFLTVKLIEMTNPHYFCFSCKDAIDTSAVMTAGFYAFLKILSEGSTWNAQDKEWLYQLLYQSAFMMRERAVEHTALHRFVSACAVLQAEIEDKNAKLRSKCVDLYEQPLLRLI